MTGPPAGGSRRRSAFTARLTNSAAHGEPPQVLDDMRAAILRGDEPPGTAIPIEAVAEFFGVSQIPVRESLKILLGQGLVEHVPHVGFSVAMLTYAELREFYEVRRALEGAALTVACARADEAHDATLREVARRLDDARLEDRAYHQATRAFHLALIEPAGMSRLQQMYESAWNLTEAARPMAQVSQADRSVLDEDHNRMAEAFLARDAELLVALSDEHYRRLRRALRVLAGDAEILRRE